MNYRVVLYSARSMNTPSIEIFGKVPAQPSLILPAKVDLAVLCELERVLGGRDRVIWMVESSLRPAAELMQYLQETRAAGFFTAIASSGPEPVIQQIQRSLESGRHVVLLCGAEHSDAAVTDVPASFLRFADSTALSAVPVGVSMFHEDLTAYADEIADYSLLQLHFMDEVPAGASLAVRVHAAWQAASVQALAEHPLVRHASLPTALFHSLFQHSEAELIDGVDDSRMTYRRTLVYALALSRHLRHFSSSKRMGILLPPGKLSVIANIACLFVGIAPVNINYQASAEQFALICKESGIERFIASEAFIHKCPDFSWPSRRDIVFIDKELLEIGASHLRFWELMCSLSAKKLLASRAGIKEHAPDSEAMVYYVPAGEGELKPLVYTHRTLMAAVLQMQHFLRLREGERSLYVQPLYEHEFLVPGFLLPLLLGLDLVMYPSAMADVRINTMISRYQVSHIVMQPQNVQGLFNSADSRQFGNVLRFLLVGGTVPESLIRTALTSFRLSLCECRCVPEFATPLTMVYHEDAQAVDTVPESEQQRFAGNIGRLLPGTALRSMDLAQQDLTLSPDSPGIIRFYGATLVASALSKQDAANACYTTHHLGCVNEDGELVIMGAADSYSKVSGQLVSHARAEAALCQILKVNPQDPVRRIALIGMPDPASAGHKLVMLSTVHKKVIPNDTIALYYGLINMKLPAHWAPKLILAVSAIPLLPDGSVNYEFCRRGIQNIMASSR